jgi:hypothetical protein
MKFFGIDVNRENVHRGMNGLIFTVVALDYMFNPEACAIEYIPDMALHLYEAVNPNDYSEGLIVLNALRGSQAAFHLLNQGCIGSLPNFIDIFNHGANIASHWYASNHDNEKIQEDDTKPCQATYS